MGSQALCFTFSRLHEISSDKNKNVGIVGEWESGVWRCLRRVTGGFRIFLNNRLSLLEKHKTANKSIFFGVNLVSLGLIKKQQHRHKRYC